MGFVLLAHGFVFALGLTAVVLWILQPENGVVEATAEGAPTAGLVVPESLGVAGLLAMVLSVVGRGARAFKRIG